MSAHRAGCSSVIDTVTKGFNYAYRRTASNNLALTPGSSTVNLPSNNASHPPTKVSTPVPDRSTPPHLANNNKVTSATPQTSGKLVARDSMANPEDKPTGSQSAALDRGEKERLKRERKSEKKDRERGGKDGIKDTTPGEAPVSGKDTPISPVSDSAPKSAAGPTEDVPSPAESNGARTPTSRKPARNPWTLFVRIQVGANEAEIREFFGEHGTGVGLTNLVAFTMLKYMQIIRVNYPQNHAGKAQKIAYVEFGDEEAMKAALEGHTGVSGYPLNWWDRDSRFLQTLHGVIPEVKQAADRDTREGGRGRGGPGGRGRFFSRGLADAGLRPPGAGGNGPQGP